MSSQLVLVVTMWEIVISCECALSDCSIKIAVLGRSLHWLISIPCYYYTMKKKEHSKKIREKVFEKWNSEDGHKKISKVLNIHWSSDKSIIKKWKGYGVNLPRSVCPHKLSDCARRIVRVFTRLPMTTLEKLQASAKEIETLLTTAVFHQSKLYGRMATRKPLLK